MFWGSVAMAAVMLVLVLVVVPESGVRTPGRFDWVGAILMSVALTSLLLGISKGGVWGWTSQWTLLSFTVALLVFAAWAPWELRTGEPLVDLRTSTRRPVLLTNIASLLAGFAMFANLLVATQQLQIPVSTGVGFGLDVTEAGLAMLPGGVLMVLMAPVSAEVTRRFGARITLVAGLCITGFGYVVRVLLDATLAQLVLGVCIVSVGIAVSFAAMPVLIMQSVPISETAAANGLNTVVRSIGTSTCSATVAAVFAAGVVAGGYPSEAALHSMSWLAAGAAFLAAVVGLLIPARVSPVLAARPLGPGDTSIAGRGDSVRRAGAGTEVVVRGRAQRADGRPARLAVVSVLDRSGRQADWARADNDGRWSVVLPGAGEYLVICSAEGWARSVRAPSAGARRRPSPAARPAAHRGRRHLPRRLADRRRARRADRLVGRVRRSDQDGRGGPLRDRTAAAGSVRADGAGPWHRGRRVRGRRHQCSASPLQPRAGRPVGASAVGGRGLTRAVATSDTRCVLRHLWWVLGLALVCGGVAVVLSTQAGPDDFGWFAYTPPSDDPDWHMSWRGPMTDGSALIVSRWQLAGSAVVVLGLMTIAGGAGFRLGRRDPRSAERN